MKSTSQRTHKQGNLPAIIPLSSLAIILACLFYVLFPAKFTIESPRLGQPQVLLPGQLIHLKIKSSIPFWKHRWSISLKKLDAANNQTEIPLKILSAHSFFSTQQLSLSASTPLQPGKYSLLVRDQEKLQIADSAITIWPAYKNDLSIIQLADLPTFSASGDQPGDIQFKKIIEEINIINPDLVLFTGDLVYGGRQQQYEAFYSYIKKINAPVIAAPGNHEYQGWSSFLSYFGQPYHVNNIGPLNIISINSGHGRDQLTESQLHWLKSSFSQIKAQQMQGTTILQSHHSIMHRPKQRGTLKNHVKDLINLVNENSVAIVLSGHWHADSVWNNLNQEQFSSPDFKGTPYAVTTSAGAILRQKHSSTNELFHGYRLIRIKQSKLLNYTYDFDGDGKRDASNSIPMGELQRIDKSPLSSKIVNNLNETFAAARIDFSIAGQPGKLQASQGAITHQYFDGSRTVYSVIFNLPASSSVQIDLKQPSSEAAAVTL